MGLLLRISKILDIVVSRIGNWAAWLCIPLILIIVFDVITRRFLVLGSTKLQEMEWHLFSVIILYGVSVALKDEGHVRVDFLYEKFSVRKKAMINILGTVFFLLPLALLVATGSVEFVMDAYTMGEISEDPGGLTHRWIIKSMIPLSFIFLIFSSIGYVVKNINIYRGAN